MKLLIEINDDIYEHAKESSEDSRDECNAMRAIAKGASIQSIFNNISDEIEELANLTMRYPVDMRFIELMPIQDHDEFDLEAYLPYSKVLEKLPDAVPVPQDGGVAKLYRLPGAKGNIGLISPISAHFCSECNRLRLTADGKLKPCLHAPDEYSIKGLDREGMKAVFEKAIWNKPAWHGDLDAIHRSQAGRNMNEIGG